MIPYIISLSKIESSKCSSDEVRNSLIHYGFNPVMFEGTYGDVAEKIFLEENRNLHSSHSFSENTKLTSPGVKGCFYSHFRLWSKCVELNEPIMIFEDDVIFLRNYEPIDFSEILVLSINYDWNKMREEYRTYLENEHYDKTPIQNTQHYMPGCSGYAITPLAAKKLVNKYKTTYLPADLAINSSICKIEIHPRLMGRSKTMDKKQSLTRKKDWI